MTQDKASIRINSQEKRKSILALEKCFNSEEIVERILKKDQFNQAMVIMMYMPTDYEPDIQPLIEKAQSMGKTVCIPLCQTDKQMMAVIPGDWSKLDVNSYGIAEPKEGEYTAVEPENIDVVIVPGIAFDSQCNRLGHGAGYYDRFLSKCRPDAVKIGVCFETQVYKEIPADDMDVPMDLLVTDITTYKRIP